MRKRYITLADLGYIRKYWEANRENSNSEARPLLVQGSFHKTINQKETEFTAILANRRTPLEQIFGSKSKYSKKKEDITELQKQAKEKWRDISNQYLEDRGLHELKKSEPSEKNSGKIYRCSEVWHWETPQYVVEQRSFFTYNEKDVNPRLISGNINLVLAMDAAAILTSHQAGTKENTPSSTRERRDNAKSSFTPIPLEQKKVKKIKKVIIR